MACPHARPADEEARGGASRRATPVAFDCRERRRRPVGIRVGDLSASRLLYEAALCELGLSVVGEGEFEGDAYVLFGRPGSVDFSLHTVGTQPGRDRVTTGAHVAFASSADEVRRWHGAALRHGGTDNGPPGLRPEYSGHYFAAFVLDLDGNNVEAVFHAPEPVPEAANS